MKRVARGEEPIVVVPLVVNVVEVQVTLVIVLVENRADEIAVRVPPDQNR